MGLGFEISSVASAGMLSGDNHRLIQFVRTLGTRGVIRIGGNTSDYARYSADGPPTSQPMGTVINKAVIQDLGRFLRATGWRLIWGLNLGSGSEQQAAEEAAAVAAAAPEALLAFEMGNEPDLFVPAHRQRGYDYGSYLAEYRRYKAAIRARVPDAPFAGPDVASNVQWVERFAADEGADLKLLTHHYYALGPPSNPSTTITNLLGGSERFDRKLARLEAISTAAHLPYRLCELNSCFGGGKAGVSDTFASALWVLDLMFNMAMRKCAGINVETGLNQLGKISVYSPIYPQDDGGFVARPIYYGMLAFKLAARGKLIRTNVNDRDLKLTAYATRINDNRVCVTVINKDLSSDADVHVGITHRYSKATPMRLTAPSAASTNRVTFGDAEVGTDGQWRPGPPQTLHMQNGQINLRVPKSSAALVEIQMS